MDLLVAAAVLAIIVFVLVVGFVVMAYNGLVLLRNRVLNALSQIDVQLKRRYDLIPNLVEAVKGYMSHERQTLEAVIAARNDARLAAGALAEAPANPVLMASLAAGESMLAGALMRFRGLMEAYPEIKADAGVGRLMEELTSTENRVAFARQAYNDAVMGYNTRRQSVPTSLVAGMLGFGPAPLFELADPTQREVVAVDLRAP